MTEPPTQREIDWAVRDHGKPLTGMWVAVLRCIADFARQGNEAPSMGAIAEVTRYSPEGVRHAITHLIDHGWLHAEGRGRGRRTQRYRITLP